MTDNVYTELLLDEYKHPQHKHEMKAADLVLEGGNASCGDKVKIFLKLNGDEITDISWVGNGCVISQVSMSLLAQKLKIEKCKIENLRKKDMLELLGMDEISPGREKCMMLGLNTLKKAK